MGGVGLRARALVLAAIVALALSAPASSSAAVGLRKMHISMALSYTVTGTVTRISTITLKGMPQGWTVAVRCLGHGCFPHTWHHRWRRDLALLAARRFSAGQKLVFTFRAPSYQYVAFIVQIEANSPPQVTVYKAPPRPNPALVARLTTIGILAGIVVGS